MKVVASDLIRANMALQEKIGRKLIPNDELYILDIGKTIHGDMFVLCLNLNNPVHKFVTWGIDENDYTHRWSGHYFFSLDSALQDLKERLGIM